jgi:hypothetical protein
VNTLINHWNNKAVLVFSMLASSLLSYGQKNKQTDTFDISKPALHYRSRFRAALFILHFVYGHPQRLDAG